MQSGSYLKFTQYVLKLNRHMVSQQILKCPISHYTRINNNNCETRHCSVVSVGCPLLYSDTQLSYS